METAARFALPRLAISFLSYFCFRESFMLRNMLRAKLHRATVTQADLDYEGSCGIDEDLLDAADMRECEKIDLYSANNGERFPT